MIVVHVKDEHDEWGARWGKYPGSKHLLNTEYPNKGWLGNPYVIGLDGDRDTVIDKYAKAFYKKIKENEEFKQAVLALHGKRVACFCTPQYCHLDIISDFIRSVV